MSKLEQVEPIKARLDNRTDGGRQDHRLCFLLLFQTNAEQQTKIQDLQEKLSKVDWISVSEEKR